MKHASFTINTSKHYINDIDEFFISYYLTSIIGIDGSYIFLEQQITPSIFNTVHVHFFFSWSRIFSHEVVSFSTRAFKVYLTFFAYLLSVHITLIVFTVERADYLGCYKDDVSRHLKQA